MNNKLSIIIPCYNCEKTLEEAVESIYNQDIKNFEIIMVDDKSTDSTSEVMEKIANRYKEVKTFYNDKNIGGGATRNRAVEETQGDTIFCLDSDDILPPETLKKMYLFLKEKNADGVTIEESVKFNGSNKHNIDRIDLSPFSKDKKIPLESLFSKKNSFHPLTVNFMYTIEAFNKIGGYPTEHGFDTQGFGFSFLCNGLVAYTCPKTKYLHRINFKESYYLKNYNEGKINYNWKKILLDNYFIFNNETLDYIKKFDCTNFTKNIMEDLKYKNNILVSNLEAEINKEHPKINFNFKKTKFIKRNSFKGLFLRLKSKISKMLK